MNNDTNQKTCETCRYSAHYDFTTLECRRHAPVLPTKKDQTQFPRVGRTDFCGDYEPDKGGASDGDTIDESRLAALAPIFAALAKKYGYDNAERAVLAQHPEIKGEWAEFRRQNEKKSDGL